MSILDIKNVISFFPFFLTGSSLEKIRIRFVPDPVNVRPDPKPFCICIYWCQEGVVECAADPGGRFPPLLPPQPYPSQKGNQSKLTMQSDLWGGDVKSNKFVVLDENRCGLSARP